MANSDLTIKRSVIKNFFSLGWLREKKFNMSFLIGKTGKDLIFEAILPGRGAKAKGSETALETLDIRMNIQGRKKKASLATILKWIVVEETPSEGQTGLKGDRVFFEEDLKDPKTLEETLQGEGEEAKLATDWTILGWMTIQSEVIKTADNTAAPMVAL